MNVVKATDHIKNEGQEGSWRGGGGVWGWRDYFFAVRDPDKGGMRCTVVGIPANQEPPLTTGTSWPARWRRTARRVSGENGLDCAKGGIVGEWGAGVENVKMSAASAAQQQGGSCTPRGRRGSGGSAPPRLWAAIHPAPPFFLRRISRPRCVIGH